VWDLDPNKRRFTSRAQTSRPVSLAINSDGSRVAIVDENHKVHAWDVSSGMALASLSADDRKLHGFSLTREVKGLVVDNAPAKVRDTISGRLVFTLRFRLDAIRPLALSGNGQHLATTNAAGAMRVWDPQLGELWTAPVNGNFVNAAFSSDGKWLALANRYGVDSLLICDVDARQVAYKLPPPRPEFRAFTISSDGTRLAIAYKDSIQLLNARKTARPLSAAFSADGKHLAMANQDESVKVLDVLSLAPYSSQPAKEDGPPLSEQKDVVLVASSSDGTRLATASVDGTAKVWDVLSAHEMSTHSGLGRLLNFSPDSTRLASADKEYFVNVWDTSSGKKLQTIPGRAEPKLAIFCADGARLLLGSSDDLVRIWEVPSGVEPKKLPILFRDLKAVAFSPDCGHVATANRDGSVKLWDASSGIELRNFPGSPVQMLTFSWDGTRLAAANDDGTLTVLDTAEGRRLNTLAASGRRILAMSFDPAVKEVATVLEDGEIRVDVLSVEDLMTVAGKQGNSLTPEDCKKFSLHQERCEALDWTAEAKNLAGTGRLTEAIAAFKRARRLDPTLPYDPEMEAKHLVAQFRLAEASKSIDGGNLAEAAKKFEEAKSLDPSLRIDPQTEAQRRVAQAHLRVGRNLAKEGKLPEAIKEFQQAKSFDTSLKFDPEAETKSWAAQGQVSKGLDLAQKGNIKEALAAFGSAQKLDSTKIAGESWNGLCWMGSVWAQADQVLKACEEALKLEPGNWHFKDSRGLARSLTGNRSGAIKDFQASVEQTDDAALKSQRQDWIAALREGKNPFSADVLKSLSAR
jgi:WD40 repeat protein